LMVVYRNIFQAERVYLLQQYEENHVLNEDLFNELYREIGMAEMVILGYGVMR